MNDFFTEYRKLEDIIKERIKKVPTKELLPFFNNVASTATNAKLGYNKLSNEDLISLSVYLDVDPAVFIRFQLIQENLSNWITDGENKTEKKNYVISILKVSKKIVSLRVEKPQNWKLSEIETIYFAFSNSLSIIFF